MEEKDKRNSQTEIVQGNNNMGVVGRGKKMSSQIMRRELVV